MAGNRADLARRDDNDEDESIEITLKNERTLLYWQNDDGNASSECILLPSNWSPTASISTPKRGSPIIYFQIKVAGEMFLFIIPPGNVESISTAPCVDIKGIPGHYLRTKKWCTVGIHLMKLGVLAKKSVSGTINLAVVPQELRELASAMSVSALLPIRHKRKFDRLRPLLMCLDKNPDGMGDLLRSHGPLQIIRVNEADADNKAPIPAYPTQGEKQPHSQEEKISQCQRVITPPVKTESCVKERLERADQQAKAGLDELCQSKTQADKSLLSRIETLEWTVQRVTSDADDAIKQAGATLYDFRKEMKILMDRFSEDCQQLIDGVRKDLEGQLMEEMNETRDEIMNTMFHGDDYRLDIFFDENKLQSTEEE